MVLSMEKYEALLRDFLIVARKHVTPVALKELKNSYANLINSVRTFHRINDIDHLVRVLENRGVIRYDNIKPLKDIAKKYFKSSSIYQRLEDYYLNNAFSYPAHTNLYRIGIGEFYIRKRSLNNLSFPSESENRSDPIDSNLQSCLEYKFACKLPFHIISEKESSNYDESTVFTNSFNDRSNTGILFANNFINKNNCNNHNLHVIHNVTIPHNFSTKNEQTVIVPDKTVTPLLAEENFNETSSLSTPNSHESQTTCSSQIENKLSDDYRSLINSSGSTNLNIENLSRKLIKNRKMWIFLSAVYLVLLSTPIIIFCLLKYPVQYNPEPSAPSFQEVHSGSTEPPMNPYAGYDLPWNRNVAGLQNQSQGYSGHGLTCIPVVPRMHQPTISETEQIKQHTIFQRISERMGTYWQDVARWLDVRENVIDEIEAQNCDLSVKAYTALKIFARDGDPDNWQRTLRKALENARRKDLAELVEELSSRRY